LNIDTARAAFAEELRFVAHVRSDRVVDAFATVERHRFLGERPWQIWDLEAGYWDVPGDDPCAAYHNVLFAIDAARELNNGHPEFWARLLDRLAIRAGDRVFHVGAGVGYYSAIMAELTGPDGAVIAAEIDPARAARARDNLAGRKHVAVVAGDGAGIDPGPADVIVVNAGVTYPLAAWLDALMPGGRLLVPLTGAGGRGTVFLIERGAEPGDYLAAAISGVGIYPCASVRTVPTERALSRALGRGGQGFVRSLRCDAHPSDDTCWLHGDGYCLSTRSPVARRAAPS
jgi:protein-L-isoaspartate(D-aspartate) O-methyltransferase